MKKIRVSLVIVLILSILFSNTSFAASSKSSSNSSGGITVLKEYSYTDMFGGLHILAICRNDTGVDCEASWDVITYDSSGNPLETYTPFGEYVNPNQEFVLTSGFYDSDEATAYDYEITVDTGRSLSTPMHDAVQITHQKAKNGKIIVTGTNTSSYDLMSCSAMVLFFLNGKLVDYDEVYLTNNNYQMNAGETIMKDTTNSKDYDDYAVYWTAYRW
ncbi:hypothetical protein SAMN04487928_1223 [Butyrivibrio proteoclasticus]|uniref:Uncharacterized protein n=1 Tax=Butyrivibrio proteoclasticus TaxID=43305 RepID=A0A1I5WE20_9FIRM|nr:hypothetical protein [Butyrivibrio proteoclasticus]SFQ18003.1 hypothetical protein SAMN04487928_1223 [Butyrivibrio proteoclasticus]